MTSQMINLKARPEKAAGPDFLREIIGFAAKPPVEMEVEGRTGAARGKHSRADQSGSYLPAFLKPRRMASTSLAAVVQQAYVPGVST
ncbi:MAG: IS256 family transposase, partial [Candidatus Acidiferrum sp.]